MSRPAPKRRETWVIHLVESGAIRASGHGPVGNGAMQRLRAGEALVVGLLGDPRTQKVVVGPDGEKALAAL